MTNTLNRLKLRKVSKKFGNETVVDQVDLSLRQGQIHALVGLNGAGKTTLMNMMVTALAPSSGTITYFLDDSPIDAKTMKGTNWSKVGHFIGLPFTYPELTVRETLKCSARLQGLSSSPAEQKTQKMLDHFTLMKWANFRTSKLSQGNKQRLGLACAFIASPNIVILDEPTNALDPAGVLLLREIIIATAKSGGAILVSSHHLDEVARIADQISVMHRGKIIGQLDPHTPDIERAFFTLVYEEDKNRGED